MTKDKISLRLAPQTSRERDMQWEHSPLEQMLSLDGLSENEYIQLFSKYYHAKRPKTSEDGSVKKGTDYTLQKGATFLKCMPRSLINGFREGEVNLKKENEDYSISGYEIMRLTKRKQIGNGLISYEAAAEFFYVTTDMIRALVKAKLPYTRNYFGAPTITPESVRTLFDIIHPVERNSHGPDGSYKEASMMFADNIPQTPRVNTVILKKDNEEYIPVSVLSGFTPNSDYWLLSSHTADGKRPQSEYSSRIRVLTDTSGEPIRNGFKEAMIIREDFVRFLQTREKRSGIGRKKYQ